MHFRFMRTGAGPGY
uniref:Uncharacterized protein n=1 Tax=Anguilla anguilla TaxID=7936 RepID=A0A0E9VM36_ANGAN